MKVLVAAKSDFSRKLDELKYEVFASEEGELVMPLFCWEMLGVANRRELAELKGVRTLEPTTCFRVVERSITLSQLQEEIFKALKKEGAVTKKGPWTDYAGGKAIAGAFAKAMLRAASHFSVGSVLEKYRSTFQSRVNPSKRARVLIRI